MARKTLLQSVPAVGRELFGVTPQRSYQMAAEGVIPYLRHGKRMWSSVDWALERAKVLMETKPDEYVPPRKRKSNQEAEQADST